MVPSASLLLVCVLTAGAPAAQAQTIFTDNFNGEGNSLNYNSFANWNVNWGTVDVLNFYGGFGQAVDMDGSSGVAALLVTKTSFILDSGAYTLSFALGKNGGAAESMTVSVGSVFTQVIANALSYSTPATQTFNFNIASATTGTISFDHAGRG